jgi:Na+/citrate or Na+/malate symporter
LVQTAWANYRSGDALCTGAHGATLLGCAVGDDLGFAATLLILGPVLGLGLGALAGLLGRTRSRRQDKPRASWMTTVVPLVIFSGLLAVVMIAELVGNLW